MHGDKVKKIRSLAFRNEHRLRACIAIDSAHIYPGSKGHYVGQIQRYMLYLVTCSSMHDGHTTLMQARAHAEDIRRAYPGAFQNNYGQVDEIYGSDMGNVVQIYKAQMGIKRAGQRGTDKIIGINTMKSMEQYVLDWETSLGIPHGS